MKVGDLVRAKQLSLQGWNDKGLIVAAIWGKWLKVAWADGIIQREHVNDLEIISAIKA